MIIEMSILEVKNLLSKYVELKLIEERERIGYILDKFISSGSDEMKKNFIKSFLIGIYVTDVSKAEAELKPMFIKKLVDPELCLLLMEILNDKIFLKNQSEENIKLKIFVDKYIKEEYEVKNYFNNLLVSFSNIDTGKTLNLKIIENCLTDENKKNYIKGTQKAVTTTLTGKQIDNSFRPHPEAQKKIVLIKDLRSYLILGDKSRIVKCPICNGENKITNKNLTEILQVKNDVFVYKCIHSESESKIGKDFFRMNIGQYFEKIYSEKEKSMFVLNNFDRLIDDAR